MMARYAGGRPGSSRRVRLVPVRRSGMDHRAVARIVLALARQMATDEAVQSAADDEVVSSGVGVCTEREPGTSDGRSVENDAAAPWAGAHSGQSARGGTSVGRCVAGRLPSCRHTSAHHSSHENAAPSSTPGGTP